MQAAIRELKPLKILQFTRDRDDPGHVRSLTRKELLDEVTEAAAVSGFASWALSPVTPQRQKTGGHNVLKPRDVRKVDPAFAARLEPAILVRAGCIILSLGKMTELRAIITRDRLYFVLPESRMADSILAAFRTNLSTLRAAEAERAAVEAAALSAYSASNEASPLCTSPILRPAEGQSSPVGRGPSRPFAAGGRSLSTGHLPSATATKCSDSPASNAASESARDAVDGASVAATFEFCALEALLMTAATELSRRQIELSETLKRALHLLRKSVVGTRVVAGAHQLDQVRELKQSVRELLVQSQALEEALRELLDEDEDMEGMYLTRRHQQEERAATWGTPSADEHEHEEVEMLLESYLQEVGATVAELEVLTYGIAGTEKFVSFRLDSARNRLLKVDVLATATATALGVGQLVSGIFGMNLPTELFDEENKSSHVFTIVATSTLCLVAALVVALVSFFYSPIRGWLTLCGCRAPVEQPLSAHLLAGHSGRHGAPAAAERAAAEAMADRGDGAPSRSFLRRCLPGRQRRRQPPHEPAPLTGLPPVWKPRGAEPAGGTGALPAAAAGGAPLRHPSSSKATSLLRGPSPLPGNGAAVLFVPSDRA